MDPIIETTSGETCMLINMLAWFHYPQCHRCDKGPFLFDYSIYFIWQEQLARILIEHSQMSCSIFQERNVANASQNFLPCSDFFSATDLEAKCFIKSHQNLSYFGIQTSITLSSSVMILLSYSDQSISISCTKLIKSRFSEPLNEAHSRFPLSGTMLLW